MLPYYLSLGMTWRDFYEGPPSLCPAFRKKRDLENQRMDTLAWMIGSYAYEAILDMTPFYNSFNRKPKPIEYTDSPRFFPREQAGSTKDKGNKPNRMNDESERVQASMFAFMRAHNKKMRNKAKEPEQSAADKPAGGPGV